MRPDPVDAGLTAAVFPIVWEIAMPGTSMMLAAATPARSL
jgi:hypothetical protein